MVRILHQYHRGHGFESCSSLNVFKVFLVKTAYLSVGKCDFFSLFQVCEMTDTVRIQSIKLFDQKLGLHLILVNY